MASAREIEERLWKALRGGRLAAQIWLDDNKVLTGVPVLLGWDPRREGAGEQASLDLSDRSGARC